MSTICTQPNKKTVNLHGKASVETAMYLQCCRVGDFTPTHFAPETLYFSIQESIFAISSLKLQPDALL